MNNNSVPVAATRVSREVLARLKEVARAQDRSVSAELRRLITQTYGAKVQS